MSESPIHFKGKDAVGHVAEAQASGIISAAEIHGIEIPGHISAGADAARETAVLALLLLPFLTYYGVIDKAILFLSIFFIGWIVWRMGRAAWFGWARLERLHRVLEQEKWEIEHNRPQERDELRELYRAKGFEGKLLEDVLDVLMADNDRLLRVMVEEELGLSLERLEHPLKQGLGAALGATGASLLLILGLAIGREYGLIATALGIVAGAAGCIAVYSRNRIIPAITWNVALTVLVFGLTYFILQLT